MKTKKPSIGIFPLNLGGSNACRLEIEAMFNSAYQAGSLGINLVSSPNQADLILLFGSGTSRTAPAVYRLLDSLAPHIKLVALGPELSSGAPFKSAYGTAGPFQEALAGEESSGSFQLVLPPEKKITLFIKGSPPGPQSIIDGILEAFSQ